MQNEVAELTTESKEPPVAMPVASGPSERAYFTEGELFPWKGRWFCVHLNPETHKIELEIVKSTECSSRRTARTNRWLKQHPKSDRAKD